MTRAIVAQKRASLAIPIPSRTEVGYAEDLASGELELHISGPTLGDERLIVERAEAPPRRERPAKPPPLNVDPILRLKVSHQAHHQLEALVATGFYGPNVNEAARELLYLQLRRELPPPPTAAKKPKRCRKCGRKIPRGGCRHGRRR